MPRTAPVCDLGLATPRATESSSDSTGDELEAFYAQAKAGRRRPASQPSAAEGMVLNPVYLHADAPEDRDAAQTWSGANVASGKGGASDRNNAAAGVPTPSRP